MLLGSPSFKLRSEILSFLWVRHTDSPEENSGSICRKWLQKVVRETEKDDARLELTMDLETQKDLLCN